MSEDFYIGWEARAAAGTARRVRAAVAGLLVLTAGLALALAAQQHTIGTSIFEWGTLKPVTGRLKLDPYPHLLVPRPGATGDQAGCSTYYLVAPFKHGLDRERFAGLDGQMVSLQGTLIYRGGETMIEAVPDSIHTAASPGATPAGPAAVNLGRQTLTGEIVDSKCYFGVMNPGELLPHRACAINCIRGGIPPVLLVRQQAGPAIYMLLVSATGKPVNQQVLDLVAERVQITGDVEWQDGLLILRSDPATYQRVGK